MDQLSGVIETILFTSEETGYTVARMRVSASKDPVTIVGPMPHVHPGEGVHCEGEWRTHSKHGRQFLVKHCELTMPGDVYAIQKYLGSGLVRGVGPVYAKRIVDTFGADTLKVIDETPERLREVVGIGRKRVQLMISCWEEQKSIRHLMIFLQGHSISPTFACRIYRTYGEDSVQTMKDNPYLLAKDIFGIGFKTADRVAKSLLFVQDDPRRVRAGITHVLWEVSGEGHVCYRLQDFIPKAQAILEVEASLIEKEVDFLKEAGEVICSKLPCEQKEEIFIWTTPLYLAEEGIAREIARIKHGPRGIREIREEQAMTWAEKKFPHLRFSQEQRVAIIQSLREKFQIITGGPGTGKSTITLVTLLILSQVTDEIMLAAPTGRAAKRMQEITKKKASTIHALLEFDVRTKRFKRHRTNPLSAQVLIIDETSMIDTQLMYHLLKAISDHTHVILIGDVDQLPSVGPGQVFKDLIDSSILPVVVLKQIFRQGKGSRIVINAHRINAGHFPFLTNEKKGDFVFFEISSPEEILDRIVEIIKERIPKRFPFHPRYDIQVLSPMKRGILGTDHLNEVLQRALNPQSYQLTRMNRTFQVEDKVIQIRNNYDKQVFNGEIGAIASIDFSSQQMIVTFDERSVEYGFSDLDELCLAYAVSIHKYQGSESPCVIMPIHTSHFKLLFRNLFYTGITRGKRLVVLLGTKQAIAIAVRTDSATHRSTGLRTMLRGERSLL